MKTLTSINLSIIPSHNLGLKGATLNFVLGGQRFTHIRRVQDDEAIAQILSLARGRLNGEDAYRRLCEKLPKDQMRQWMRVGEERIHKATPQHWIADWDSTVVNKYGDQEDAEVAPHLNISIRALSTYKTRGLPDKQKPMAKKLMENWSEIVSVRECNREEQTLIVKVPAWKFN